MTILIGGTLMILFVIPMTVPVEETGSSSEVEDTDGSLTRTAEKVRTEEVTQYAENNPLMIMERAEGYVKQKIQTDYGLREESVRDVTADSLKTVKKGQWKVRGHWMEVNWECIVYAGTDQLQVTSFRAGADLDE
jgi:hypothetical protein